MRKHLPVFAAALAVGTYVAAAQEVSVDMHKITAEGVGDKVGTVTLSDGEGGLTLKVSVAGVAGGEHGFHVHQNGACGPGEKDGKTQAGLAAGAHYDPADTKSHEGPEGHGHKGDLPKLQSTANGIDETVTAPRVKLADVLGRALVIHEGGDTYSNTPELGGGKGRIVCGVVPKS